MNAVADALGQALEDYRHHLFYYGDDDGGGTSLPQMAAMAARLHRAIMAEETTPEVMFSDQDEVATFNYFLNEYKKSHEI